MKAWKHGHRSLVSECCGICRHLYLDITLTCHNCWHEDPLQLFCADLGKTQLLSELLDSAVSS